MVIATDWWNRHSSVTLTEYGIFHEVDSTGHSVFSRRPRRLLESRDPAGPGV